MPRSIRTTSYAVFLVGSIAAIWAVIQYGESLYPLSLDISSATGAAADGARSSSSVGALGTLKGNLSSPTSALLVQVLVVLSVARFFGWILRRIGQPRVVGEILAGILLGPSCFKALLPAAHAWIFKESSLGALFLLSQIGLVLFMFIVGLELELRMLRTQARSAVVISHVSIVLPFLLGSALALVLYSGYSPSHIGFTSFCLFMGIAMSITAFPVLARILHEKGLTQTRLGATAISCAAVDDLSAWILLAAVIGIVNAQGSGAAIATLLLTAGYLALMILVVRPLMRRLYPDPANLTPSTVTKSVSIAILGLVVSALMTEAIGIHALFGAFVMGVITPESHELRSRIEERLRDAATSFLLPLFFAFTGLRTQIGLLGDSSAWLVCGLITLVAVTGKLGGSAVAARFTGFKWRDSWIIGSLMNTRGLMELVVLNIGYDLGILTPTVFTMMIIMAVSTTMMTGPLVDWLRGSPDGSTQGKPA